MLFQCYQRRCYKMKISIKSNLYDIWDKFHCKWVNVWLKNGKIVKVFLLDIDFLEDNDVGDAIIYNTTGSLDYGDAIYLKDMNEIELYKDGKSRE